MTGDLFADQAIQSGRTDLGEGAMILRGFASPVAADLVAAVESIVESAPWRHLITPGGFRMSVAMTNSGQLGWISDTRGYRYEANDPLTGRPWPPLPECFRELARAASIEAGFAPIAPEACLINRYEPGARLTLHQDRDELDLQAPIVSVSLGLPAVFLFGGNTRKERPRRVRVESGDVAVWGGPSRLAYHGIAPLAKGWHPLTGAFRINLTFRKVR